MSIANESATLITDFVDFLATQPPPEEVARWRPSPEAQARLSDLLLRNNAGTLDREEYAELQDSLQAESMLRLLKAKLLATIAKRKS